MFVPPIAKPMSADPRRSTGDAKRPSQLAIGPSGQRASPVPVSGAGLSIQAKLKVRAIDDPSEREADCVADQVLRMPEPAASVGSAPQRISKDRATAQNKGPEPRTAAGEAGIVQQTLRSPGRPLDPASRSYFEPRFKRDFSRVRVHADQGAADAAQDLAAHAFTVGEHIVFGGNQYTPRGADGARLLAHELTHVVQQSGGSAKQSSGRLAASLPPISSSGIALHRDDKPDPANRPGAAWPYGPITKRKSVTRDLFDYILMVKRVERLTGLDKQSVLQKLRRLYYSSYTGKGQYDTVIAEQAGAGGSSQTPLDAREVGTAVLDDLYETNVLKLPDGELIDVSHVLVALDAKTSGLTSKAKAAEGLIGIRWMGVLTWAGDLASWMANYIEADRKSPEGPPMAADPAPQKVNLISDMDAQILAEQSVRESTTGPKLRKPVSELLDAYFGIGQGTTQPANLRNRFDTFVRIATPPIPHRDNKGGPATLTADAPDAIYEAIYNTAWLLVVHGSSYSFGRDVLALYTGHFRELARRYVQFLTTGLEKGDANWPPISFNP